MSQFIGNAQPQFRLEANNLALLGVPWQPERERARASQPQSFATPWWPNRNQFVGDLGADVSMLEGAYYEPEITKGMNSRFGYQGVTRDVNNSPLGGCTVILFLTSDDSKVTPNITSEADGTFVISTPNYAPHYIVTRKSGSPEVAGVTVSTNYPNT